MQKPAAALAMLCIVAPAAVRVLAAPPQKRERALDEAIQVARDFGVEAPKPQAPPRPREVPAAPRSPVERGFLLLCNNRTQCRDYCVSGYVWVSGDACNTEWNYQRGCYRAYGICNHGVSSQAHSLGAASDQGFIGCRPSPGECLNSCPRGLKVRARQDPKLCPDEREPMACYCQSKN